MWVLLIIGSVPLTATESEATQSARPAFFGLPLLTPFTFCNGAFDPDHGQANAGTAVDYRIS
jgi:hypothetical protein